MWLTGTVPFIRTVQGLVLYLHARSARLAMLNFEKNGLLLFGVGVLDEGLFGSVFQQDVVIIRV